MFQKCPICNGEGVVNGTVCDVCKGAKIISSITGLPPARTSNNIDYILNIDGQEFHSEYVEESKLRIDRLTDVEYLRFREKNNRQKMFSKSETSENYDYRTFFEKGKLMNCLTVVSEIDKSVVVVYDYKTINYE